MSQLSEQGLEIICNLCRPVSTFQLLVRENAVPFLLHETGVCDPPVLLVPTDFLDIVEKLFWSLSPSRYKGKIYWVSYVYFLALNFVN
jgi:hypothetical protein